MKAFTDILQSKKLAEFLPLESADMFWLVLGNTPRVHVLTEPLSNYSQWESYPCWSLTALLDYLSANFHTDIKYLDNYWELDCRVQVTYNKELVDACYEMFTKLHKQKLLLL